MALSYDSSATTLVIWTWATTSPPRGSSATPGNVLGMGLDRRTTFPPGPIEKRVKLGSEPPEMYSAPSNPESCAAQRNVPAFKPGFEEPPTTLPDESRKATPA